MATAQPPADRWPPHTGPPRRAATSRRRGLLVPLAQAALALRHRAHRRLPDRAHPLQLRGAQRPARLRAAGQVPQRPAPGPRAGVDLHLHPPPLSRPLTASTSGCAGQSNVVYYPWAGNWLYVAQRWTGSSPSLYIVQHVLRQRFIGVSLPEQSRRRLP